METQQALEATVEDTDFRLITRDRLIHRSVAVIHPPPDDQGQVTDLLLRLCEREHQW